MGGASTCAHRLVRTAKRLRILGLEPRILRLLTRTRTRAISNRDQAWDYVDHFLVSPAVAPTTVNLRFQDAMSSKAKLRTYASSLYQVGSWERRPKSSWPEQLEGSGYERDERRERWLTRVAAVV